MLESKEALDLGSSESQRLLEVGVLHRTVGVMGTLLSQGRYPDVHQSLNRLRNGGGVYVEEDEEGLKAVKLHEQVPVPFLGEIGHPLPEGGDLPGVLLDELAEDFYRN